MYNRYKRGGNLSDDEVFIRPSDTKAQPVENIRRERVRPERKKYPEHNKLTPHETKNPKNKQKRGGLSGLTDTFGGLLKGFNLSDWDTGDILLVLILIFLFLEGGDDNDELIIALALVLILGI